MKVRIKFRKYGAMIFIGHLDTMRFFQKLIRRADIDVSYTQGFSPHQIMSFAAPLGVGLCSNGEYLDLGCEHVTSTKDMIERLNQASVEGYEITNVVLLPEDAGNAMASVAAATYTVHMRYEQPEIDFASQISAFLKQETISVVKQTKKSEKVLDIKPLIFDLDVSYEEVDGKRRPVFSMMVDASSAGNVKPALVLDTLYTFASLPTPKEFDYIITREDTYTNIGTSEEPKLVPLDAVGNTI